MPSDPAEEARCSGIISWFSSVVQPSYQRSHRPERFAEGEAAQTAVKETRAVNCQEIDSMVQGNDWVMGHEYTLVPIRTLWFSTAGRAQRTSHEGAQCLHGMAGAHDETAKVQKSVEAWNVST